MTDRASVHRSCAFRRSWACLVGLKFEIHMFSDQWFPVSSARTQTASCAYAVTTHRRVIKTIVTLLFPAASAYICNTPPRAGPSHHSTGLSISKSPVNDYSLCVTTADQIRDRTTPGTFLSTTGILSQQPSYIQ
jgi:hypothetical protein